MRVWPGSWSGPDTPCGPTTTAGTARQRAATTTSGTSLTRAASSASSATCSPSAPSSGAEGQDGAGRTVALFAHSMGTFISQAALALHPPSPWRAVILAGSDAPGGLSYRAFLQTAKAERGLHGPRGRSTALDELAFGPYNMAFRPTRTDSDWLSRDPEEVDRFLADPRTGFQFTNQAWVDFIGGREHVAHTGFDALEPKDLPILLIAGDKDPVGRKGKGVRKLADKLRAAGMDDVEVRLYPGARHELINETNRDEVHADVLAFLERTIG